MTFYANRHNIEPMLRCIALLMMILLGGFRAVVTEQGIWPGQSTGFDGVKDRFTSFNLFRMSNVKSICSNGMDFSAFFALLVTFYLGLTLFALLITFFLSLTFFTLGIALLTSLTSFCLVIFFEILREAGFAIISEPISVGRRFVKFRDWFDFFASATSFRYDFGSHFRSFQRLWLEPIAAYTVVGSSYFKITEQEINK